MNQNKTITLVRKPIVKLIASMCLHPEALDMVEWIKSRRPECLPDGTAQTIIDLLPHSGWEGERLLTDNELLVEIAGRKCYDSFADKAGRKSNREYIAHTQEGEVKHSSILYHAKMTFFIAGVSRRVSHELIRNYVGADRDQEGAPSQESTRFTHHHGFYVVPPKALEMGDWEVTKFYRAMQENHDEYEHALNRAMADYVDTHGQEPKGLDRKRCYEYAAGYLDGQAETSFIWTTNPVALAKLFRERGHEAADAEFRRLVLDVWKPLAISHFPNLFI